MDGNGLGFPPWFNIATAAPSGRVSPFSRNMDSWGESFWNLRFSGILFGMCFLFFRGLNQDFFWLVVEPTDLKNISQNGNLPQIGVKIKNIWNYHLDDSASWMSSPLICFMNVWLNQDFFRGNFIMSKVWLPLSSGWFFANPSEKIQ